jgi:5-methylcytosine-specific restriction endonuclease McrA
MARSGRLRNRVRMGRASRRRIRAGGPLALGRPAASIEQWREIRAQVLARAHWACQACSIRTRLDVHHVTKRAQGGSDFDLDRLIALCRDCHAKTDASFRQGRLVVTPLGDGRFHCEVRQGDSKWSVQDSDRDAAAVPHGAVRSSEDRWRCDGSHSKGSGS